MTAKTNHDFDDIAHNVISRQHLFNKSLLKNNFISYFSFNKSHCPLETNFYVMDVNVFVHNIARHEFDGLNKLRALFCMALFFSFQWCKKNCNCHVNPSIKRSKKCNAVIYLKRDVDSSMREMYSVKIQDEGLLRIKFSRYA